MSAKTWKRGPARGKTYQALAALAVGEFLILDTPIKRDTYQKCANRYGIRVTTQKLHGVGWRVERIAQ